MKKKAIKLAAASAVAASAFVASAPAQTDAASNVAVEVSKAVTQMKKAYHTYSDVTAKGEFADIKVVYKEYNAAKAAYNNAKALVNKAGGSKKDAYLAELDSTYNEYIKKRVVTYIDAYNYATKLDGKRVALEKAIADKDLAAAEKYYHEISYELKTRTVILDRVYGKTTRELLRSEFKTAAQDVRDSLIYDVTVAMKLRAAEEAVNKGDLATAEKALAAANEYLPKVTETFKAELTAENTKVKAAYEAALTPKVESVSAINAKTIKVQFNKAIDDTKAKFEVKKGSVTINVAKTTLSADKKSVELELASKLFEGEYTVNVTGISKEALSGSVKVENEKVAKIELLGEVAPLTADGKKATVAYRVLNQYGEDITKSPLSTGLTWTASNGITAEDDDKGTLTLTSAGTFKVGDKVALTGINAATNTVVTGVVTISNASVVDTVEFQGLYHKDGKELTSDATITDFALLIDAKDQYGKAVKAAQVNSDVLFTSSNPSLVSVKTAKDGQGKDKNQVGLELQFGENSSLGGKAIITAISKTTGKVSQFEVNVKAATKLDSFSMTAPAEIVAAGDTVKIPFTAVDQYGNTLTKFKEITGLTLSATDNVKPVLKPDENGNAYLEYKPATKGTKVIIATTSTGKVSQLTLDVKEAAEAVTIESLKDVTTTVAVGGKAEVTVKNLEVKDQYGRTFKLADNLGTYKVVPAETENNDSVKVSGEISSTNDKIVVEGVKKGSEEITLTLQKGGKDVATSPIKVTFNVTDKTAFTSYEVADVATIYANTDETYARELKVYGLTEKGEKVLLPASNYTVHTSGSLLTYNKETGKLDVAKTADELEAAFKDKTELKSTVTIVVDAADKPVTLTKEITLSNVAPKADKVEFDSEKVKEGVASVAATDLSTDNDSAALKGVLKVTDQYGFTYNPENVVFTVTNLVDAKEDDTQITVDKNGTSVVDVKGASKGDTFAVTYIVDGKTASVKFRVTE
ncbi:hypothetical protein C0966_13065 [Bacillus methanolicus]|uniref:hypothetical protein n=1 Tax=Bacillus methanolicus TaxID=1471 RepID=UPI002380AA5E|nr:hypothetical protein [Bacillus methanolicus]MDE3840264.1 hypothetical protein [Bacillus methanolicus]